MKFICDDNLGKLAAYLRILGFDTKFDENIDDAALLRIASGEQRLLLTRDRKLASKSHPYGILILTADDPLRQLSTIIGVLKLIIEVDSLFARCSRCNETCKIVEKNRLSEKIFPYILKTQSIIKRCPSCGRYYWKGSHYKAILKKLKSAIDDKDISGKWPDTDRGRTK
ncbi:MAG: Mut7-C RNAse domain-containing protein [candidate division Zixibacteria bacterium]